MRAAARPPLPPRTLSRRRRRCRYRAELVRAHEEEGGGAGGRAGPPARFEFAELFAGIGGFRLGLEQVGGRAVFASELNHEARCTYARNFGEVPEGDVTEIDAASVPGHQLLTAGFPCQSHTKAGFQRAFDDYRGALFFEVVRFIRAHRPAALLLENVPGLERTDDGAALRTVLGELEAAGYAMTTRVLSAASWVPQHRERLYFVGFRKDTDAASRFSWPVLPDGPVPAVRTILQPPEEIDVLGHVLSDHKWFKAATAKKTGGELASRLVRLDGAARTLVSSYRTGFRHYSEFVPHLEADGTVADHQRHYDAAFPRARDGASPPVKAARLDLADAADVEEEEEEEAAAPDYVQIGPGYPRNPRYFTVREVGMRARAVGPGCESPFLTSARCRRRASWGSRTRLWWRTRARGGTASSRSSATQWSRPSSPPLRGPSWPPACSTAYPVESRSSTNTMPSAPHCVSVSGPTQALGIALVVPPERFIANRSCVLPPDHRSVGRNTMAPGAFGGALWHRDLCRA